MIRKTRTANKKPILTAIGIVLGIVLVVGGIVGFQFKKMFAAGENFTQPPVTVTTVIAEHQTWEKTLTSVGSVAAVQGVTVAAEMPGKIESVAFTPGASVEAGTLLVQQDISAETAQLQAAQARAELARLELARVREVREKNLTSKSDLDRAQSEYRAANAEADNMRAAIAKKTIRAPFAGRLGTRTVYAGQYLRAGDPVVSLQALESMLINFQLPQRMLPRIGAGMKVRVTGDALDGETLEGDITAVDPAVDSASRNVAVQATVGNPDEKLLSGMFVDVAVLLPEQRDVLAVPNTAILYAPYGASVFVVEEKTDEQSGETKKTVRQQFVKLGENQGDFVDVVSGVEAGQTLVSTGVFKLRNGQAIVVDNEEAPAFELNPKPENG